MAGNNRCVVSQCNIHIANNSYAHQHEVEIVFNRINGGNPRILTRCSDAFTKATCRHILNNLPELHHVAIAYDGRGILLTATALPDDVVNVPVEVDDFLHDSLGGEGTILVTITWVRSVNISDFSVYEHGDPNAAEDRTLRNFLEMILSQDALTRNDTPFASTGSGQLCELASTPFDRGTVIRDGNNKGVHIITSNQGPQPVVALNACKKMFYPSNANFLAFLFNFMGDRPNYEEATRLCRGMKLQLTYNRSRILTFKGFTNECLGDLPPIESDNGPITIPDYYYNTYRVEIRNIRQPGAIMMQGTGYFPLELLQIVEDQAIPAFRLPDQLRERGLQINRLRPADRHDAIWSQFERMRMNNPTSHAFGVEIEERLIRGTFTRLGRMTLVAGNNQQIQPNDMGSFRFDKNQYILRGCLDRIVVLSSFHDRNKSMDCCRAIVAECRRKGMVVPDPEWIEFNSYNATMNQWMEAMQQFKRTKTLVVSVDNSRQMHAMIKLAEALTGVPTQQIQLRTANDVARGSPQTRENIVHKINLKAGGLNHRILFSPALRNLDINRKNILVIGLDCCHPTGENMRGPTAEPSFVGITGNYLAEPCAFAGTFFLQNSRQESVSSDTLRLYTQQMLRLVSQHRNIDTIVLMRDGVSEGQYNMVITQELDAIRKAATDHFKHQKTRLVGIVVTKNGNARHFDNSNGKVQSLPPRSVVTFGTRTNYSQFYIVPHRAMQGTAKAVMITVLQDDIGLTDDEKQRFVMGLTNLHQIVCSPISLPEPIYQADKLALRGQLVYRCFIQHYAERVPRHLADGAVNFIQLTNLLSFNNGDLPLTRFTA